MFKTKLADKSLYTASLDKIELSLAKMQKLDRIVQKTKAKGLNGYKNIDGVLHY